MTGLEGELTGGLVRQAGAVPRVRVPVDGALSLWYAGTRLVARSPAESREHLASGTKEPRRMLDADRILQ